jgi:predicted MPP superfamily phosphohydrolase
MLKTVTVELPRDLPAVELHTFADWHIGDKFCTLEEIKAQVDRVKDNPYAYIILNGDLLNNATKASVSDVYAELLTPMQQIATAVELLKPVKDKILFADSGNHEARTYRNDGIDITAFIMKELGIEDRYCREGGVLFIKVGESPNVKNTTDSSKKAQVLYAISIIHGSGGGRKEGAKAIRLADMASIVDADIYIHSHTHLPMIMRQATYRTDMSNCKLKKVDKLFINTAAKLKYGGYGQTYEFKPASTNDVIIYLNGTRKEFSAEL